MNKPKNFESITQMTEEFEMGVKRAPVDVTLASVWQLRILLSIAQQLSVIAAALKDKEGSA